MYNNQRILAVIPARGGSKGIPNKNVTKINERPLIDYTISEAIKSKYIDRVIVSTDSDSIAVVARASGADVPFVRPKHLAKDNSKIIDVLIDLLKTLSDRNEVYDYIVLLQPTQPLRQTFHIDEAIRQSVDNNYKSLVSVNIVNEHPLFIRTIDDHGKLRSLLNQQSTVRRQDLQKYYKVNGAIYINKIDEDFNNNTSLNDNDYPYIMDGKYDLDIDTPSDLKMFKMKLNSIED